MPRSVDIEYPVDLVRRGARRLSGDPFAFDQVLGACVWIQDAGMPEPYRLDQTARDYARIDDSEHLAAVLAARIGDADVAPIPPLWPLLALVLLGWHETLPAATIVDHARELDAGTRAARGLAIVGHLYPELREWLGDYRLEIPRWEQFIGVPLAARRLVLLEKMD